MHRFFLLAAAVSVACVGLTGCASAARHSSVRRPDSSFPRGGDGRLVGTWKISTAQDGAQRISADAGAYEYLVFKATGDLTRYAGDSTETWSWSAQDGRLVLRPADDQSAGYAEVSDISGEVDKLESSDRIAYQVSGGLLTLSGTFRDYSDVLAHPSEIPTTAPPAIPVRISYVRLHGPPPARTGQPATAPSAKASRPTRP